MPAHVVTGSPNTRSERSFLALGSRSVPSRTCYRALTNEDPAAAGAISGSWW